MELLTIGYEGLSPECFFDRLRTGNVRIIVDVRQNPISRKKGFSKKALAAAAKANGFEYVHLREFGCPKAIRDAYKKDKDWARYTAGYKAHLATLDIAVARLAREALAVRCCLLCFEADPQTCHRSFVAARVAQVAAGSACLVIQHLPLPEAVTTPMSVAA